MPRIDTGDGVFIAEIGEKWLVAYNDGGYVACCGWPETLVKVEKCELVRKATPEARLNLLHELARLGDSRGEYARRELTRASDPDDEIANPEEANDEDR